MAGRQRLAELSVYVLQGGVEPWPQSGKQEMLENLVNSLARD
jgi:xylose isomerase